MIAIHGWFADRRAYEPLWPFIVIDGHRFAWAFLDLRGYGSARAVPGQHTMAEVASDVLDLAGELGWQRFSLVGHSMGGMAIQHVLLSSPERVEALVGVAPVAAAGVEFDEDNWQLFSGAAADASKRRAIIDFTTGHRLPDGWLDSVVERSFQCCDAGAFGDYLPAWARTDIHELVRANSVRTLLIAGSHDPALGPPTMKKTWLAWYPNATMEVLADAGHYAIDEEPLATLGLIERFLAP